MPIRKIAVPHVWTTKPCLHSEHNPPTHWCPDPGIYEHKCPACGKTTIINVPYITC
jgi:predicted RNA-binding Zn-ribbon protein involved in translation (DUF1610 family)